MDNSLTAFLCLCLGIFAGAFFCYWIKDGKDKTILLDDCNAIKSAQSTFVTAALVPYGHDVITPNPDDPSNPSVIREFTDAQVQTALNNYYSTVAQIP